MPKQTEYIVVEGTEIASIQTKVQEKIDDDGFEAFGNLVVVHIANRSCLYYQPMVK